MTAEPETAPRVAGAARRPPLLLLGGGSALTALVLALLAAVGPVALVPALLVLQVVLVLGVLALVDAPASSGAFALAAVAALAADVALVLADGDVGVLAGVVGLGLVATLLQQLSRRSRSRVTEAMADTLVVVVLVSSAACLVALAALDGGREVLLASLAAAGTALLAGRLGDLVLPRPALAVGALRGWPGLLLGLGAGLAASVLVAGSVEGEALTGLRAALVGLSAAAVVAAADLAVDLSAAELRAGWRDARRVAALRPVGLLLPFAVLGPVALVAGRLVLGG